MLLRQSILATADRSIPHWVRKYTPEGIKRSVGVKGARVPKLLGQKLETHGSKKFARYAARTGRGSKLEAQRWMAKAHPRADQKIQAARLQGRPMREPKA